jgi:hypothetical protein
MAVTKVSEESAVSTLRTVEQLSAVNLVVINDWVEHAASFFMVADNVYFRS